jgi:GH15 family glucan-1,4-alpha-glucosidase
MTSTSSPRLGLLSLVAIGLTLSLLPSLVEAAPQAARASEDRPHSLQLSRPVRPWEFLPVVGKRAGLLGNEAGQMEAWVYPLKLLRDFRLQFLTEGRILPAETLARTLITRPESSTIVYTGDTFSVRETFFVPVDEPGALILLEVETEFPLEIEARFLRDFQLEWPAGLGGTYSFWDQDSKAFVLGEETRKYVALVGSPTATEERREYQTNYSESSVNSFRLGATLKGKESKLIVMAGSLEGRKQAEATYKYLAGDYAGLLRSSAEYYQKYLAATVSLELPDTQIQQAYDWSRVSMVQGIVSNPFLGTGLVAGYRTSGQSQRPGFAWFFGRDSMWTSLALNAAGDFSTTRTALDFIGKYQREDGKIPHEIAQGASFVPWFQDFPYGYASADATPLYIIAMDDYATQSGDVAFAKEKWDSVWKAWQFLRSTYDERGFPRNFGIGHGWVEGGPLLPVESEFYQTGLGTTALQALSHLAALTGKDSVSAELAQNFETQKRKVNEAFWLPSKQRYAFAIAADGQPIDEPSVLATVPMWFGLPEQKNAGAMITQLAGADHQTDWGMRIISDHSPKFSGGGYHYGSVWPLFTGWASVGEYRYHRPQPAYDNLRANALLALDGSLGHVTEVLSGDYYQPLSTSSPHQIWSAAMVVSPLLRGMLGLSADAKAVTLTFAPHLPADWNSLGIDNLRIGETKLQLNFTRTAEGTFLEAGRTAGTGEIMIEFRPAISSRATVLRAELNGKPLPFKVEANEEDQHVLVRFPVAEGQKFLRIIISNDFAVTATASLSPLGSVSSGLRVLSETWSPSHDQLTLDVSGAAGAQYRLSVWNAAQIERVEGAQLKKKPEGSTLTLQIPGNAAAAYAQSKIVIHFASAESRSKNKGKRQPKT